MTCGSKCTCKKEEWNNGTIYRIFVQRGINATSNIIDVPVDIAQSELTGKVFIGVENFCLDRRLAPKSDFNISKLQDQTSQLVNNWAQVQYLQLRSVNLPPDIDWTAAEDGSLAQNTQIFARLPLDAQFIGPNTWGNAGTHYTMNPRASGFFPLNKDGILYEMTNNPNALSNGRLRIQLVDNNNGPWDLTNYPIYNFQFTVVIYKPRNTYN